MLQEAQPGTPSQHHAGRCHKGLFIQGCITKAFKPRGQNALVDVDGGQQTSRYSNPDLKRQFGANDFRAWHLMLWGNPFQNRMPEIFHRMALMDCRMLRGNLSGRPKHLQSCQALR